MYPIASEEFFVNSDSRDLKDIYLLVHCEARVFQKTISGGDPVKLI